jgi:YD repeat-containing protein
MSNIGTQNKITNIGQLTEGLKVVLNIEGNDILDAKVHIGTGTLGKPRVWFCQNTARGSDNDNAYGYDYAFSVGVEANGALRLEGNDVRGLRAYDADIDDLAEITRRAEAELRRRQAELTAARRQAELAAARELRRQEEEANAARRLAALRAGRPILTLRTGETVSEYDYTEDGRTVGVTSATFNGVKYSNGTASAGMEFKTVSKFAEAIAERELAIAKYRANKAQYNVFARRFGWSRV